MDVLFQTTSSEPKVNSNMPCLHCTAVLHFVFTLLLHLQCVFAWYLLLFCSFDVFLLLLRSFSYYQLQDAESSTVNKFLTSVVDKALNELQDSYCIEIEEVCVYSVSYELNLTFSPSNTG